MRGADEASRCRQDSDRNGCLGIVAKTHPYGVAGSYSRLLHATSIMRVLSAEWLDGSYPEMANASGSGQFEVPELRGYWPDQTDPDNPIATAGDELQIWGSSNLLQTPRSVALMSTGLMFAGNRALAEQAPTRAEHDGGTSSGGSGRRARVQQTRRAVSGYSPRHAASSLAVQLGDEVADGGIVKLTASIAVADS